MQYYQRCSIFTKKSLGRVLLKPSHESFINHKDCLIIRWVFLSFFLLVYWKGKQGELYVFKCTSHYFCWCVQSVLVTHLPSKERMRSILCKRVYTLKKSPSNFPGSHWPNSFYSQEYVSLMKPGVFPDILIPYTDQNPHRIPLYKFVYFLTGMSFPGYSSSHSKPGIFQDLWKSVGIPIPRRTFPWYFPSPVRNSHKNFRDLLTWIFICSVKEEKILFDSANKFLPSAMNVSRIR